MCSSIKYVELGDIECVVDKCSMVVDTQNTIIWSQISLSCFTA